MEQFINEEIKSKIETLYKVGKVVANQVTDDVMALELQEFYDEWQSNFI